MMLFGKKHKMPVGKYGSLGLLLLLTISISGCAQKTAVKTATPLLAEPVINKRLSSEDFGFPSSPPSLTTGREIFKANCLSCHAASYWQTPKVQADLRYTTPIDMYLMLSTGKAPQVTEPSNERRQLLPATHPQFTAQKMTRDERWAAIFYARYLAGSGDINYQTLDGKPIDVASIFGGNCAVCHGKKGFADGPLHTGRASSHELASAPVHGGLFEPPPANFHEYRRLYNRTDAQLFKYISEGLYPSGMPPWAGRVDKDYNYKFDDKLRWMLVRHVRQFGYTNDLPETEKAPVGSIPAAVESTPSQEKGAAH